jgi:two-component response regulator (ARR-B family)
MLKGKAHGACVCLVKPVDINVLKNIWQHVVRKKNSVVNRISSDKDDACKRVRLWTDEDEQSATQSNKCSKKKKNDGDDPDETKETTNGVDNQKKPRVAWTGELQDKFNKVVEQLGIDSKSSHFIAYSPKRVYSFWIYFQ